jgi:hypothetical protein
MPTIHNLTRRAIGASTLLFVLAITRGRLIETVVGADSESWIASDLMEGASQ